MSNGLAFAALAPTEPKNGAPPSYRVLGVRVNAVQITDAVRIMRGWVDDRGPCRYVVVTGMHGITLAQHDAGYRRVLNEADMCVADGWPVMMLGRLSGFPMARRVYGPELMLAFIEQTAALGYRHFLYGGPPGVAEELGRRLSDRVPGFRAVGAYSPPFGPVAPREDPAVLDLIRAARPDVLWVGIGTPKQECWMHRRRADLDVPLLVGVGAAFDFHAGRVRQAPRWMREHGFEWLYRLAVEPRRLWRRYLVNGGEFAIRVLTEIFTGGFKRGP